MVTVTKRDDTTNALPSDKNVEMGKTERPLHEYSGLSQYREWMEATHFLFLVPFFLVVFLVVSFLVVFFRFTT
ncbi:MAG: hypothetical protein A2Z21_07550 [Candidatus Fraserbacteria bacterium RBG_16_55_9]|uniref:Uncharacterized protein n=1 Tax=Fraserbacteria sp. (strain RBG_16_55_9) TaxID=1817864 RepID=A0A1F5UQV5_FRAXR|nr:MAG: hypothetical protein A2Z21_07550 [Candidatus Fraserbacteria bacterium RBG_16_55_9]